MVVPTQLYRPKMLKKCRTCGLKYRVVCTSIGCGWTPTSRRNVTWR